MEYFTSRSFKYFYVNMKTYKINIGTRTRWDGRNFFFVRFILQITASMENIEGIFANI